MPTALITGSSDGIGWETAKGLLAQGWTVLVHGRNKARAEEAVSALEGPRERVRPVWGDLASLEQVRNLAAQASALELALDALVLNAGVFESKPARTGDGFERTMGINHFAHVYLLLRLRQVLALAPAPRLIWVSSGVHHGAALDPQDLDLTRGWSPYGAYASSKLANAVCAAEIARRPEFRGILSFSLHPGVVSTKLLTRNFGATGVPRPQGARTSLYCILEPGLEARQGGYFERQALSKADPRVYDAAFGKELWEKTLERLPK